MQVELEMGEDTNGTSGQIPEHSELLEAARQHVIRQSPTGELRNLIDSLEIACDAARMAAVHAMYEPRPRSGDAGACDPNAGFADLFAALRRTRAEVQRRKADPPGRMASAPPEHSRVSLSRMATLGLAFRVLQKARR